MEQKLFSVIMPTLNCGSKVDATIRSVLSQRESLVELIIVDGGSTDDTLSIIGKYVGELKLISERDEGAYDAMNKGIDMAAGRYLYFLGAGDCLREGVLEEIMSAMPDQPLAFVYGDVFRLNLDTIYKGKFSKSKLRRNNICHQAIFYERTIFDVIGRYDIKYRQLADYAFNIKCFADSLIQFKYLNCVIADYEGDGVSENIVDHLFWSDHPQLVERYLSREPYFIQGVRRWAFALAHRYRNTLENILLVRRR